MKLLALAFTIAIGFGQPPPGDSTTPRRPFREVLLQKAQKGDRDAQLELAKNYEAGRIGLPVDLAQARHWYLEAANQGEPFAEASMGILYNFGKGVDRDYAEAYMWYERSASHLTGGDRESVVEMRDALVPKLTPEQIAKARKRASDWKSPSRQ